MSHNNRTNYMSMRSMMGYITPIIHKLLMVQRYYTNHNISLSLNVRKPYKNLWYWWQTMTIFQEDAFSSDVVAELLSREDETLADSLFTWVKAVVKTLWKHFLVNIYLMKIHTKKPVSCYFKNCVQISFSCIETADCWFGQSDWESFSWPLGSKSRK